MRGGLCDTNVLEEAARKDPDFRVRHDMNQRRITRGIADYLLANLKMVELIDPQVAIEARGRLEQ